MKAQDIDQATLDKKAYHRAYYQATKKKRLERARLAYAENRQAKLAYGKTYYEANKAEVNRKGTIRMAKRMASDPLFKLAMTLRHRIYNSMKCNGYTKKSKTTSILGCDFNHFKNHIEKQFEVGMTWENHGLWHYDHITPVSWALTEDEVIKLNHFTNFQPKWAKDNLTKGNRYEG